MLIIFFIALGIVVNSVQCQCGADGGISYDSVAGNLRPCCADHDNCYSKCGKTQVACDEAFHRCMKNKCGNNGGCLRKADIFYLAVASRGREAYNNTQRASGCKNKYMYLNELFRFSVFPLATPTGTGCPFNESMQNV